MWIYRYGLQGLSIFLFFKNRDFIWERLDRSFANNDWLIHFGGSFIHHLTCNTSDHSPLWILPEILDVTIQAKPFRFEEMWLAEKGCTNIVQSEWNKHRVDNNAEGIVPKIELCDSALKKWSSKNFGSVRRELHLKKKLLAKAELDALLTGVNFKARMLKSEVNDLMEKETRMWFQRSCSLWATFGDKNSKYFHSRATQRYQRNKINGVRDGRGHWKHDPKEIANEFLKYFAKLFYISNNCQPELALDTIQSLVTDDMNRSLSEEFIKDEVKMALNQMAPLKSPGPDGMPPLFFQHYWDLVGKDITTSILFFLNLASLPKNLNHTFITLILKVKNLELVSDFRPISLCNVLYKLFSKVLVNKLKKILPHIISEH